MEQLIDQLKQEIKRADMVCCPLCDKEKCVGRYKCNEIKQYIEERRKRLHELR